MEVVGKATLPDGMQQIVSLDAHVPSPEDFHALQQTALSPRSETHMITPMFTPRATIMSLPWHFHAATMEQRLSSHSQKVSESCGGSPYASMSRAGDSSEISACSLAVAGKRSPSSLDQDALYFNPRSREALPHATKAR